VAGIIMTGEPDQVAPLVPVDLPGLVRTPYQAYPVADHIADKLCALLEVHPRQGGVAMESTRYRDLVDLTVFARTEQPHAAAVRRALDSESARRALQLPQSLPAPAGAGWTTGYARAARDVPQLAPGDLGTAIHLVREFLDPVLNGTAQGRWDPGNTNWRA
jgi:hypothetical protein